MSTTVRCVTAAVNIRGELRAGRAQCRIGAVDGIVKLFENTCGSVDVSGLCGGT